MSTRLDSLASEVALIAATLQRRAKYRIFTGGTSSEDERHIARSRVVHPPTGAVVLFTRDAGMHTSGWMRNPDYERCLHLSLSPSPRGPQVLDPWTAIERLWCRAFFGDDCRHLWMESAKTAVGQRFEVRHWRLFCAPDWSPLHPRGEVYSSTHTPLDWRSWSQVHADDGGPLVESVVDPT